MSNKTQQLDKLIEDLYLAYLRKVTFDYIKKADIHFGYNLIDILYKEIDDIITEIGILNEDLPEEDDFVVLYGDVPSSKTTQIVNETEAKAEKEIRKRWESALH